MRSLRLQDRKVFEVLGAQRLPPHGARERHVRDMRERIPERDKSTQSQTYGAYDVGIRVQTLREEFQTQTEAGDAFENPRRRERSQVSDLRELFQGKVQRQRAYRQSSQIGRRFRRVEYFPRTDG